MAFFTAALRPLAGRFATVLFGAGLLGASLLAAVQPADTRALYFVARGDGSSHFSATLDEHNAAVRQYQLKR